MPCRTDRPTGRVNGCRYETVYADLHFVGDSCSSGNTLLEKTIEGGADTQEYNDPEHRHDESQRQAARKHQYVNEQNVDNDRSEQGQRERDVAIDQEQDRRNDLEQKYRDQIMGDKEGPNELADRKSTRLNSSH